MRLSTHAVRLRLTHATIPVIAAGGIFNLSPPDTIDLVHAT